MIDLASKAAQSSTRERTFEERRALKHRHRFPAMGGVGVLLVRTSFTHAFLVAQFVIGAVWVAFAGGCVIAVIEDFSVLLDRSGIEKLRLLYAGEFFVRKRLAWNDIEGFTQRGLTYRFKSAEFEVRLNIASFTNEAEFTDFVQANLPAETIAASFSNTLAPSRTGTCRRVYSARLRKRRGDSR